MQKSGRGVHELLFGLEYSQLKDFDPSPIVLVAILLLQFGLYLIKLYSLVNPLFLNSLGLSFTLVFLAETVAISAFLLLTLIAYNFSILGVLWGYCLLGMESVSMLVIETGSQCFGDGGWCGNQVKYELSMVLLLVCYLLVIYLRSYFYYPFHNSYKCLSMTTGVRVFTLFGYAVLLELCCHSIGSDSTKEQAVLVIAVVLYGANREPVWNHPQIRQVWDILITILLWTSLIIYLGPLLRVLSSKQDLPRQHLFWYLLGYSTPVIVLLTYLRGREKEQERQQQSNDEFLPQGFASKWVSLFRSDFSKPFDLKELYIMCTQLVAEVEVVKKSQLKANSAEFKRLWTLINEHNTFCRDVDCPLLSLEDMRVARGDDFLQQKRLLKTVQSCLQFGQFVLQGQKNNFPNDRKLDIEIANYELQVFHHRQKGLVLFNTYYAAENCTFEDRYALFFLKRKIEQFYASHQQYSRSNGETELSQFKHNIQVSVTMLAEFWYFLSDPKCNLKKLYDLANILFPLKIGVDNEWESIRKLRSIQSYNLYARYLIKMFNDKEKGLQILQQARKIEQQAREKEEIEIGLQGATGNLADQQGIIFLQFDGKKSGIMYHVNTSCEKMFGYASGELLNRKVNDIMPRIISTYHDRILENYQQTNKGRMMNKQRMVWGRAKDGYLFPITILIKPIRNYFSQTSQVYASVKRELWVRENACVMLDMDHNVTDFSTSLLGLYPQLYGRLQTRKKLPVQQVLPEFNALKENLLSLKDPYEFKLKRECEEKEKVFFETTAAFSVSLEQIHITIAGKIGYMMKFVRSSQASEEGLHFAEIDNKPRKDRYLPSLIMERDTEADLKFRGQAKALKDSVMSRHCQFRFFLTSAERDTVAKGVLERDTIAKGGLGSSEVSNPVAKYQGGVATDCQEMSKSIFSLMNHTFERQKKESVQMAGPIRHYGKDIKTKRLVGHLIREIHDFSEVSLFDENLAEKEQEKQETIEYIKPSQLNAILEKEASNRQITILKLITVLMLTTSSVLYILQYVLLLQRSNQATTIAKQIRSMQEMQADLQYAHQMLDKWQLYGVSPNDTFTFVSLVSAVNIYLNSLTLTNEIPIMYSDMSNQTILLSFALNKWVSEAGAVSTSTSVTLPSDSHVFYLGYNTVNAINLGCSWAVEALQQSFVSLISGTLTFNIVYLGVVGSVFLVLLLGKNVILNLVLKKKAEILNIFFVIPRAACNSIQKECERFIQKLSVEDDNAEMDSCGSDDEEKQIAKDKRGKQKKRTIMGEEKTANNFVLATAAFLAVILAYHIFMLANALAKRDTLDYVYSASFDIFAYERDTAMTVSFMNSYIVHPSYPLNNRKDALRVIDELRANLTSLLKDISKEFYFLNEVFDTAYLQAFNILLYENNCNDNCSLNEGEDKGLNAVVYYSFAYIAGKHFQLNNEVTTAGSASHLLISESILAEEQQMQKILKNNWRKLTQIVLDGLVRFMGSNDLASFVLMVVICLCNFTVLLFVWIRFYNNLEQKIIATEYILTFIPIDEINKNPKIVKYIKQDILDKK